MRGYLGGDVQTRQATVQPAPFAKSCYALSTASQLSLLINRLAEGLNWRSIEYKKNVDNVSANMYTNMACVRMHFFASKKCPLQQI